MTSYFDYSICPPWLRINDSRFDAMIAQENAIENPEYREEMLKSHSALSQRMKPGYRIQCMKPVKITYLGETLVFKSKTDATEWFCENVDDKNPLSVKYWWDNRKYKLREYGIEVISDK